MKIVVAMPVTEEHKKWLNAAAGDYPVYFADNQAAVGVQVPEDVLSDTEIIIGNLDPELVKKAPKLRWMQLNSAGTGAYIKKGVLPEGAVLTNATGAYGLALSEHMLAQLLAMMKKLYAYYDNQKQSLWKDEGPVTSVYGARALVIGFGDIGSEFGKRLKALGAHVTGIRRRSTVVPPEADEMGTMDKLDDYLAKADIVATSLPDTPATYHLYNKERFAAMKQGAWFINIGRGNCVVQEDLMEAVKSGHLAGAALDVTDPEPLPADDPMWQVPGIYITPHVSGGYHLAETHNRIVQIACENLEAYFYGGKMKNIVDFQTGYKK